MTLKDWPSHAMSSIYTHVNSVLKRVCTCLNETHCSSFLLNRKEELMHAQILWDFMLVEIYKETFYNVLEIFQNKTCVAGLRR